MIDRFHGCSIREQVISLNLISQSCVLNSDSTPLTRLLLTCSLAHCPFIWLRISKLPNLVNSQCSTNQDHGSTCLHGVRFSSPLSTVYLSSSPEYPRSCSSYLQKEISDDSWSQAQARNRMSTAIDMFKKVFLCSSVLSIPLS